MKNVPLLASFSFGVAVATSLTLPAHAQAVASPSPSSSSSPAPVSDPCGSILSIVTRPTVTTSVCTVRPNHILVENGWTNTVTTGTGGGNTAAYPQSFIRIGTSIPHLEVAVTPPSAERSSLGDTLVDGTGDVNFGLKYELGYTSKAVWGVNAQVSVPSGASAFTAGGTQYTGNFNWGYTLNSEFGFSGTLGFNSLTGFGTPGNVERFFSFIPSVELTAALPATSQAFIEYAYFSQAGVGLGSKSLVDFGLQKDFGPHVQVDVEYGFSPTTLNDQRQHYIGAGLSLMN